MDFKAAIMETLARLQKLTVQGSEDWKKFDELKKVAERERDPAKLAMMHRHLVEVLEIESEGQVKTPMRVQQEDGKVSEYKTIDEVVLAPRPAPTGGAARPRLRRERR